MSSVEPPTKRSRIDDRYADVGASLFGMLVEHHMNNAEARMPDYENDETEGHAYEPSWTVAAIDALSRTSKTLRDRHRAVVPALERRVTAVVPQYENDDPSNLISRLIRGRDGRLSEVRSTVYGLDWNGATVPLIHQTRYLENGTEAGRVVRSHAYWDRPAGMHTSAHFKDGAGGKRAEEKALATNAADSEEWRRIVGE